MEELKIAIAKKSNVTAKELAKFVKQFNLLKNEEAKKQIILLVKSLLKAQNK